MPRSRSRSIQARIQQLVLVCVIPGWLLLIAATLLGYQRERDAQQRDACNTARTLANALEAELDGHVVAMQTLATSATLDPLDLPALRQRASRVLQLLHGETIVLTDAEGQQLMNLLLPPGAPLPPPRPGVYPPGADPRAPMVSDLFVGSVSQRQQVAVHVPVLRGGELRYRLSLVLPVQRLGDFLQRQNLPAGWISSVIDRQGITLARTLNAERFTGQPVVSTLLEKVLNHPSSCFLNTTREGVVVFAGHARTARYAWSTTIGVPEEALTADLRRRLAIFSAIAVALLVSGLALARLLGRRIVEPIQALVAPALAIGSGKQVDIPEPTMDEARQLADALRQAQALLREREQARQETQAALRESEAMLRRALETGRLGVWDIDLSTGELHHSLQHDRCFGHPDGCARWTSDDFKRAVHPDDLEWLVRANEKAMQTNEMLHTEFRVIWPDGSVHWLSSHSQVVKSDDGPRYLGLVTEITERKQAEEMRLRSVALEAENRQVLEANRLKREFLAQMSHELRTPLNAIIGFAELLRSSPLPPDSPRRAEFLAHIAAGGQHLLQLVNDVLDLSKVEAGRMDFVAAPIDLPTLVDEALALVRPDAERKRITLGMDLQPLPGLRLDPARLKQVLLNYLSNAVKFTPEGGRIQVRALPLGPDRWRLEVEDSGVGISEADQARLFAQFQQLRQGRSPPQAGTGLGLALTRRLVELQGGTVGVQSTPGHGSTFHAELPRVFPAAP
jgi:PAS domain S-box-containing protein